VLSSLFVFPLSLFLSHGCPGFIFTGAGIGAGNKVEEAPGNDARRVDPVNPARVDLANDGSWADSATIAGDGQVEVTMPIGMFSLFPTFQACLRELVFLLTLICFLSSGIASTELMPRSPEVVLVKDASDGDDMDPPAMQSVGLSSRASPHGWKCWSCSWVLLQVALWEIAQRSLSL
jgi:hypothetical protein